MSSHVLRRSLAVLVLLIAAGGAFLVLRGGGEKERTAALACPKGYIRAEADLVERARGERESERGRSRGETPSSKYCMNINHPEMPEDIAKFGEAAGLRMGGDHPGQLRAALARV